MTTSRPMHSEEGIRAFQDRFAIHQPQASAADQIAEHRCSTGRTATGGAHMNRGAAWYRVELRAGAQGGGA